MQLSDHEPSTTGHLWPVEPRQVVKYGSYTVTQWLDINRQNQHDFEYRAVRVTRNGKSVSHQDEVELVGGNYDVAYGRRGFVVGFIVERCLSEDERIVTVKFHHLPQVVSVKLEDLEVRIP